jgi:hypothetical protein
MTPLRAGRYDCPLSSHVVWAHGETFDLYRAPPSSCVIHIMWTCGPPPQKEHGREAHVEVGDQEAVRSRDRKFPSLLRQQ